ncbi:MAG: hypothetical protein OQJ84_01710 [Xanthomonadales bacterium]|nr:hypothetical protein [Xanthomonadales bacterium]
MNRMIKTSSQSLLFLTIVMLFAFTPAAQAKKSDNDKYLKKTIAVVDFSSRVADFKGGAGFVEMLTNALFQSDRFVVVERNSLWQVLDEQDFAASDRSAAAVKTAVTGKVLPAQLLIIGAITDAATNGAQKKSSSGISVAGFRFGSGKAKASMTVIIRILDSSTGEILDSVSIEHESESGGQGVSGCVFGVCGSSDSSEGKYWAKITEEVIIMAVDEIVERTKNIPLEGKLIRVDGPTIYTNVGDRNGVSSGDTFSVYAPGIELIDPDTGESLGSDMSKVGSIRLVNVQEKFSGAVAETGGGFQQGFIIKPSAAAGSSWNEPE